MTGVTRRALVGATLAGALAGCARPATSGGANPSPTTSATPGSASPSETPSSTPTPSPTWQLPAKEQIVAEFREAKAKQWGWKVTGVVNRTRHKHVTLTFDACGGATGGSGFDEDLIALLVRLKVPAVLFWNQRWIKANPSIVKDLAKNPLFQIQAHGTRHIPLSISGRSAYSIKGTANVPEIYDELTSGDEWFLKALGRRPEWFRPGTAYCDEIAAAIAVKLRRPIVGFTVNADGGATLTAAEVASELSRVTAGDIVISHMNRPGSGTAKGYAKVLPKLLDSGIRFGLL